MKEELPRFPLLPKGRIQPKEDSDQSSDFKTHEARNCMYIMTSLYQAISWKCSITVYWGPISARLLYESGKLVHTPSEKCFSIFSLQRRRTVTWTLSEVEQFVKPSNRESTQLQWKADFMNKIHSISCSHFWKFRVRNKNVLSAQFGDDKKERA